LYRENYYLDTSNYRVFYTCFDPHFNLKDQLRGLPSFVLSPNIRTIDEW